MRSFAVTPSLAASLPNYRSISRSTSSGTAPLRQRHIARAGGFDEGAAQVRRLLDRDRKELDFDELESAFAEPSGDVEAPASTSESSPATPANSGAKFAADKTPVSPFGPSSGATASPFGASTSGSISSPTRKPFGEPAGLSPTMQPDVIEEKPWWTKITLTQVVIVLSFTTIISLMIATFFFVLSTGAIKLNTE